MSIKSTPSQRPDATAAAQQAATAKGTPDAGRGTSREGDVQFGQAGQAVVRFHVSKTRQRTRVLTAPKPQKSAPKPRPRRSGASSAAGQAGGDFDTPNLEEDDDDDEAGAVGSASSGHTGLTSRAMQEGKGAEDETNEDGHDEAMRQARRISRNERRNQPSADSISAEPAAAMLQATQQQRGRGGSGLLQRVVAEFAANLARPSPAARPPEVGLGVVRAQLIAAVKSGAIKPRSDAASADLNCLLPVVLLGLQRRRPASVQALAAAKATVLATPPAPGARLTPSRPRPSEVEP